MPEQIGQLSVLSLLFLHKNQLRVLPPTIGRLVRLELLYLYKNLLEELPQEIGQLRALRELDLNGNRLRALPAEIGGLSELRQLYLHNNRLGNLPREIGKLGSLKLLYLYNNQLKGVPAEIGYLDALEELYLTSNQLKSLPLEMREMKQLRVLFLHENPDLALSPSILGGNPLADSGQNTWASAQSILHFYFGRKSGMTRPLNEVKLVFVGRGGAGKTSTVDALQGRSFNPTEASTPGIALCDWELDGCEGEPVTAHVWDFAGQVITHALHQFFFSVRSIYLLVLAGRENSEREDADFWLRLIRAFGTDDKGNGPPVIIALNKWDEAACRPKVDRGALQERYPFIRAFVETDCKSRRGIAELKTILCREVDGLKWVREDFPAHWDAVRRALLADGTKRAHITYAEFQLLCERHNVSDPAQQDSLAEVLHNLGAALNYRNDPRLREATVLLPDWLTKNVYALMRRAEEYEGTLHPTEVAKVLAEERDLAMRDYLMRIMERFEIAYAPRTAGGAWLVPQALPHSQPKGVEVFGAAEDATRLRYTYVALPEGLVARAIVRLHEFIEETGGKKLQWGSGAVLAREDARALLRTEPPNQVMITVTGSADARRQLAGLCQAEMRDIHTKIPGLHPQEETYSQGVWIDIATLELDEKKHKETAISLPGEGSTTIDPTLLNNAYTREAARKGDLWKPKAFICYSKANMRQRDRLGKVLTILRNEGLLHGSWYDLMINAGDDWHEAIQQEIAKADVIIVMVTFDMLATDYITTKEIPLALKLQKAVIPVILSACPWKRTILGERQALPDEGKPLDQWVPQSKAWHQVAVGLTRVFEELIAKNGV